MNSNQHTKQCRICKKHCCALVRHQLAALFILLAAAIGVNGNVGIGHNANEFTHLCSLIALADALPGLPQAPPAEVAAYSELLQLNMSLSDESWQKMFSKNGDNKNWHEAKPDGLKDPGGWAEQWTDWLSALKAIKTADGGKHIQKRGFHSLLPEQRQQAAARIKTLTERAGHLMSEYKTQRQAIDAVTDESARKDLNLAAYGQNIATKAAPAVASAFADGGGANYAASCETTKSAIKAKSIIATLACICAKADANNVDGVCGLPVKLGTTWSVDASAPQAAQLTEPKAYCQPSTAKVLTAAVLEQKITEATNDFKISNADATLGASMSGSCNGKDSGGICVKVTGVVAGGTFEVDKIPWIATLSTLLVKLHNREAAITKANSIASQLQVELVHAYRLAEEIKELPTPSSNAQGSATNNTPSKVAATDEACAEQGVSKCEKPCKLVDEEGGKKKCKLDKEAKQAVEKEIQETEGKDGKTNTNTTASNSFVIHKAPLLLAVFIWGRKIFKIFARIYEIYETCYF
ncbi:Trypanosomal VSG domain containing protein, putative [Trypanosoma equiperdum]|uniref:Trypanosomal VSG domain containing protein, putative n=1 Tax=Trypanosoma equiperdum TaxID=5694 RepID=A0A1G4IFZ5_TRYEQ|nr:Trypanosomal VSG domain containing protein, putative [Trypanosoma equiperdum]